MKVNKNALYLFIGLFLFVLPPSLYFVKNISDKLLTNHHSFQDMNQTGSIIHADYADGTTSMNEMKKRSHTIIHGKVVSQEQFSEMAVVSYVQVFDTFKGKKFDTIKVHQLAKMGQRDVLKPNREYILFLGKSSISENSFYIKGGFQGIFELNENGEIDIKDPFMKEDFLTNIKKNQEHKKDIEILLEFAKKEENEYK